MPASADSMFEQTYELLPNSWLYLTVPKGSANSVLIVETVTPGPLMLPLIRVRKLPQSYLVTQKKLTLFLERWIPLCALSRWMEPTHNLAPLGFGRFA
jgi:hypothetical protein